jgi:hypothetical protein
MKNNETADGPKPAGKQTTQKPIEVLWETLEKRPLANTGDGRVILKWIFGKQVARMTSIQLAEKKNALIEGFGFSDV